MIQTNFKWWQAGWTRLLIPLSIFFSLLVTAGSAQAYTIRGVSWSGASATYRVDSSMSSLGGSNWVNTANGAATDWSSVTSSPFVFPSNSSSSNSIKAGNLGGCPTLLAKTALSWNTSTNRFTQFTTTVNIGCGFPFYDGTQASTVPSNYYDLRSLLRHELGHALGLCHSSTSGMLMYTSLNAGQQYFIGTDASNGDAKIYNINYTGPGPSGGCIQ